MLCHISVSRSLIFCSLCGPFWHSSFQYGPKGFLLLSFDYSRLHTFTIPHEFVKMNQCVDRTSTTNPYSFRPTCQQLGLSPLPTGLVRSKHGLSALISWLLGVTSPSQSQRFLYIPNGLPVWNIFSKTPCTQQIGNQDTTLTLVKTKAVVSLSPSLQTAKLFSMTMLWYASVIFVTPFAALCDY